MSAGDGCLGHSHLNQVFKHIWAKVALGVPELADREGRASVDLLAQVDEKSAKACEEGIMLEILSLELVTNEGRGCEISQAATNSQNAVALTH